MLAETFDNGKLSAVSSLFTESKNSPRLGGPPLDVIPQQLEKYQPLDTSIIAKITQKVNKQGGVSEGGVA